MPAQWGANRSPGFRSGDRVRADLETAGLSNPTLGRSTCAATSAIPRWSARVLSLVDELEPRALSNTSYVTLIILAVRMECSLGILDVFRSSFREKLGYGLVASAGAPGHEVVAEYEEYLARAHPLGVLKITHAYVLSVPKVYNMVVFLRQSMIAIITKMHHSQAMLVAC